MSDPAQSLPAGQIVELITGATMAATVPLSVLVGFLVRTRAVDAGELIREMESKLDASGLQGEMGELVRPIWSNLIASLKAEASGRG